MSELEAARERYKEALEAYIEAVRHEHEIEFRRDYTLTRDGTYEAMLEGNDEHNRRSIATSNAAEALDWAMYWFQQAVRTYPDEVLS